MSTIKEVSGEFETNDMLDTEIMNILQNEAIEPASSNISTDEEEIGEKKNPTFILFDYEYDRDSTIVGVFIIFIWIIIWYSSGLWKTLKYDWTFLVIFFSFIFYNFVQIYNAGITSGGVVYELNILLTVEQMVSILFGTMVVFALFSHNLKEKMGIHDSCMKIISKLSISIVLILTLGSLWINVITTGEMFRTIRKFKQGVYNVALMLFIIIALILYKGQECV